MPGPARPDRRPLPCCLAAALLGSLAAFDASPARAAACTLTLSAPADGSVQVQSPQFRWNGTCSAWQLWFSPSGTFSGDLTTLSWQTTRNRRLDEATWDGYQDGAWAGGVSWKVRGRAADGTLSFSAVRRIGMDPDIDDDGVSVSMGDCDDHDAAVLPGAEETCNGIDDDCSGVADDVDLWHTSTLDCGAVRLTGGEPSLLTGNSVAFAGDVDGDGYSDVLIGGPGYGPSGTGAGGAWVVRGPFAEDRSLASADAVLVGEGSLDEAGHHVRGAGDFNGDGFDDVIVGAYLHDAGGNNAGAAYVVFGPMEGVIGLGTADARLLGAAAGDRAGHEVSGAGDTDADGYDDVLVSGYLNDLGGANAGAAYLVRGPVEGDLVLSDADGILVGEAPGDGAGQSVSGAGDVNGDGFDDVVLGAPGHDGAGSSTGAAYLVLGPVTGTIDLGSADAILLGEAAGDLAGFSVSGAGDVDGDGYDDVIVGAHQNDRGGNDAGAVYLVRGPIAGTVPLGSASAILVGEAAGDRAGESVDGAGDVDGDGYADLVVGAITHDGGGDAAGAVYVVLGPVAGTLDLSLAGARFVGEATDAFLGDSVGGGGDVDADGYADLVAGAPLDARGGATSGTTYVLRGGPR